jgi:hypothetical protein
MGIENCDKNVWAVALRDIVFKKFPSGQNSLTLSEESRNKEIS